MGRIITYLVIGLWLASIVSAVEVVDESYTAGVYFGGAGMHEVKDGQEVHAMVGQNVIEYSQLADQAIQVGFLAWSFISGVTGVVPPTPLVAMVLFIEDKGIEWVRINWTS